MDKPPTTNPAEALAAALDWWREAGVDGDFADEPTNWLARPETAEAGAPAAGPAAVVLAPPEPEIPPLGGEQETWPATLEAFGPWWADLAEMPGSAPPVAPRGAPGAELMILVTMPEAEDRERLLSGRQGELVGNMLRAMGIDQDRAYLASALPRHAGHPDWHGLADRELGKILLHHVRLAAPRRLLILGREMLPLFGHDPAQGAANALQIALEGLEVPALASFGVETLLDQPRFRKALWQGWIEWTEGSQ